LKAAVVNGADAVYFGLQDGFNARARASNFPIDELVDVMNYLHDRSVKGYLVVNVLVFDEEVERLKGLIPKIALAGVDALIMQVSR
jgi:U32 family peptidase